MKSSIFTLSIVLFLSSGCTSMMDSIADANQQTWRALKPKAFDSDWSSGGEEEIDQWGFVGEEARGDRPKEADPDPWWQKYVMSSKARNIERNLGIE